MDVADRFLNLSFPQEKAWVKSIKTIGTAYVPVCKILVDPSLLNDGGDQIVGAELMPVDISLEGPQHGGIASSLFIREMIKPGGPYAHGVPLTLVLKTMLNQRGLNQPWGGGLSSYALMLMVISVLQQFELPDVARANVVYILKAVDEIQRLQSAGLQASPNKGSSNKGPCSSVKAEGGNTSGSSTTTVSPSHTPTSQQLSAAPGDLSYRLWSQFNANGSDGIERHPSSSSNGQSPSQGLLLTYFLEYFGRHFNPSTEGIAVYQGFGIPFALSDYLMTIQALLVPGAQGPITPDPITILDPLDVTINVSRCCFRIGEIQYIFAECVRQLEVKGTEMTGSKPPGVDSLANVLGLIMSV